jgi:hypothetical protein
VLSASLVVIGQAQESPTPRVWAITPDTTTPTSDTLHYTVTFSEAVTGVDVSDFSTAGDDTGASIRSVTVSANPAIYDVTVSLGAIHRKLLLVVNDDDTIRNATDIPLGGVGVANGNAISSSTVSYTAPSSVDTVTTPHLADPQLGGIDIGENASLKLTKPANLPVISYYDATNKDLKLSICNDVICSAPIIRTVDSVGDVGSNSALALTTTNIPVISYVDFQPGDLKLAICNNPTCTAPIIRTIDSQGDTGYYSSIILTSTNVPIISYWNYTAWELKLAVCNSLMCTATTIRTIDDLGNVGSYNFIALTNNNFPVISYVNLSSKSLMLAICTDATCTTPILRTLSTGNEPGKNSLKLTSSNIPVISYYKATTADLVLAICVDPTCTSQLPHVTVDADGLVGSFNSLALTTHNIPVISYYDYTNYNLKLAVCNNIQCTSPTIRTLDTSGDVGSWNSLTLGASPHPFIINPVVGYMDTTNTSLKLYSGSQLIDVHTTVDTGSPHAFGKSSPANNAINQPQAAILQWAPSQYATTYQYCIATSIAACTSWNTVSASTTQINLALSGLSKNTTYYWQVRAVNGAGTTVSNGGYWKFTTVK